MFFTTQRYIKCNWNSRYKNDNGLGKFDMRKMFHGYCWYITTPFFVNKVNIETYVFLTNWKLSCTSVWIPFLLLNSIWKVDILELRIFFFWAFFAPPPRLAKPYVALTTLYTTYVVITLGAPCHMFQLLLPTVFMSFGQCSKSNIKLLSIARCHK